MRTMTRLASVAGAAAVSGALLVGGTAYAAGTTPAPSTSASSSSTSTECHGRAKDLTPEQCADFKAKRQALHAARDAILTKYGITPPTKGHRVDRDQVKALSRIQKLQLRSELLGWRAQLFQLYADFGLELPARPHRGSATG